MTVLASDERLALDPITFEVIRNKLRAIAEEQAITLKQVSGSPVVTDATDFNNGLYLNDGSIVTMGPQVLVHSGSMSTVISSIMDEFAGRNEIHPGDMFILNDPYRGAVHQADMSIVAPIYDGDEHIAWTGTCAHQLDVGGMTFGGWAYAATEIQQEAMLLPGIKLVDRGALREDVWRTILGMSRLPTLLGLDLKAMIAANNVAIKRMGEVMGRYGADVVLAVMQTDLANSERQFRAKLAAMPDGVFRARDFIEHDGHHDELYDVEVTITKTGDELIVDFDGSSPQTPGFINCTWAGLRGSVFTAVLPILAPDLRWNQGILRPIQIRAEKGLICNASWPAPVSMATVATMWIVQNITATALSRLAACHPSTEKEPMGVTKGSMIVLTLNGQDRDGSRYGTFLLDSMAGGGGAYTDHDGLDAAGDFSVPKPSVTNVETNEANGPLIYLYRSFVPDTAGPGRERGGSTVGIALTSHDVPALQAMMVSHGSKVPNSTGIFGGMPGSCNSAGIVHPRNAADLFGAVDGPDSLLASGPGKVLGPKPGHFELGANDVFYYSFQGGGGFGDPLTRHPEAVAVDVAQLFVTRDSARRHYGVVLTEDGEVDEALTRALRSEKVTQRLGGAAPSSVPDGSHGGQLVGGTFRLLADGTLACRCGHDLATVGGDWKGAALTRTVTPEDFGANVRLRGELELREHVCPACGLLLETEVARQGVPSITSIRLTAGMINRLRRFHHECRHR